GKADRRLGGLAALAAPHAVGSRGLPDSARRDRHCVRAQHPPGRAGPGAAHRVRRGHRSGGERVHCPARDTGPTRSDAGLMLRLLALGVTVAVVWFVVAGPDLATAVPRSTALALGFALIAA